MLTPRILQQRSSWPSSFVTGLIGWNGFAIIAALAFGYGGPKSTLFLAASLAAVFEVLVLRVAFMAFGLDRSVWRGAIWGTVLGAIIVALEMLFLPVIKDNLLVSMLVGIYVGPPVGIFLSYFYRDDRGIHADAAAAGKPVDYGRDGHWLEPFLYGAVLYPIAFVPRSLDLALCTIVIGSMTGVVAAGVSHFFLSRWSNAGWTIPASGLVGAAFGAVTGLLFRGFQPELSLPALYHGAIAGALTFAVTSAVGRTLAAREEAALAEKAQ